jgi:hypothetical protein
LRTGTMISASGGKGGSVTAPDAAWFDDNISASATIRPRFLHGFHKTARVMTNSPLENPSELSWTTQQSVADHRREERFRRLCDWS